MFTVDIWGNLTNRDAVASKDMYEPLNVGPALASNQLPGFGYDPSGNMTQNGGAQYTYDAESRLTSAGGVNYFYDGDGNRVEQSSGTLYWGSGPLSESDLNGANWTDYIFFNGKRVARIDPNGNLHYYLSDHLGSTSVVTDASGNIQSESDYYPYGGEMPITSGDTNHYKFTGKERDTESGLDNFGARYDSSALGRFMTPDWAARPTTVPYAVFGDPQSLNLYGYVRNDPVSIADVNGHVIDLLGTDKDKREEQARIAANASAIGKNGVRESSLFKQVTDKHGKTSLVLDKSAAAKYKGHHSVGYKLLVTAINSKAVASVEMAHNDSSTKLFPNGNSLVTLDVRRQNL